jgi:hypothetical protein
VSPPLTQRCSSVDEAIRRFLRRISIVCSTGMHVSDGEPVACQPRRH